MQMRPRRSIENLSSLVALARNARRFRLTSSLSVGHRLPLILVTGAVALLWASRCVSVRVREMLDRSPIPGRRPSHLAFATPALLDLPPPSRPSHRDVSPRFSLTPNLNQRDESFLGLKRLRWHTIVDHLGLGEPVMEPDLVGMRDTVSPSLLCPTEVVSD